MLSQFLGGPFYDNLIIAIKYALFVLPFALPLLLLKVLFDKWVDFRRLAYWQGMGSVLLEIKLPREISKSPAAMELVLGTLHQTADESNWYQKYWKGQTRSWFSLEIVSMGGEVRFFIWSRLKYKSNIEAQIYAQYPGVEIQVVDDYTLPYTYDQNKYKIFACEWALTQPDPYPIKTYVDYGLDKDPKEEFKIDPMASMIEFLGSIQKGHMVWIQMIIRAHKKEQRKVLTWKERWEKLQWSEETDAWKDEAANEIKKIVEKFRPEDKEKQSRQATEGERDTIAALERSITKFPFDVGIRSIYISEKDLFNASYIGGMLGIFKQFSSPSLNGFKSAGWSSIFGAPWHSWFIDKERRDKWVIEEYKMRRFFFSPYKGRKFYSKPFVLNTEELATIFHFPGEVSATPTFERVPSKKYRAPSNLPV